jgi:DNA-binding NarL/FixJ family response regulator
MRIVIGEDEVLLRDALEHLLTGAGHDVVGSAGDGPELVRQALTARPELVIADVRMPSSQRDEGLRAAHQIRAAAPATAILVLSHHLQVRYAVELLAADARGVGYLLKQRMAEVERFLAALDEIGAGGTVIDAEVVAVMMARLRAPALDADALLALIAQGRTDASIASELTLGEAEVARRVARAFAALGLPAVAAGHERVSALVRRARSGVRSLAAGDVMLARAPARTGRDRLLIASRPGSQPFGS